MPDDPAHRLLVIINSSWKSQAVRAATELNLAEHLTTGPKTFEQLAMLTNTHTPSLHRLLRALVTLDICAERDDGSFEITPTGEAIPQLKSWSIWWGQHLWPVWENLLYSVRTGKSARAMLTGSEGFDHLKRDPAAAAIFDRAMAELTRLETASILRVYDFSAFNTIVDVGGGIGELLAAILEAHPHSRGILFDRPDAKPPIPIDRCDFVAGDFFESIPAGGDLYIVKSVLHDWDDAKCREILGRCRRAMDNGVRLLVIERILPRQLNSSPAHQSAARSDLNMLVALGAAERSEEQFRTMLKSIGFTVGNVIDTGAVVSIIEAIAS